MVWPPANGKQMTDFIPRDKIPNMKTIFHLASLVGFFVIAASAPNAYADANSVDPLYTSVDCPASLLGNGEFNKFPSVKYLECMELTDRRKNQNKPLTAHQLQETRSRLLNDPRYSKDTTWGATQSRGIEKQVDCMIVLGNFETCSCYAKKLPLFVSFSEYVFIINRRPEIGPSTYRLDQSKFDDLVNLLSSVRDQCIGSVQ